MMPPKIKKGDTARIIAPSSSLKASTYITKEIQQIAGSNLEKLGLKLTFGRHLNEADELKSSSVSSRIEDLHDAFSDKNVKMVLTVTGGFNSNELLPCIDFDLIKENPKIFCGFSDITTLSNAIYKKTGLITYSGPHYFNFGRENNLDYTTKHFRKCLFEDKPFEIRPAKRYYDWQDERSPRKNHGFRQIRPGKARGIIVGGNLVTFQHLAGTQYMPSLKDKILFIEDDHEEQYNHFNSTLAALTLLPDFEKIKGIIIGRFQKPTGMSAGLIKKIIERNNIPDVPIIANVDFGHTEPLITFPVGGTVSIDNEKIRIIEH